jgi:hypothetical protein
VIVPRPGIRSFDNECPPEVFHFRTTLVPKGGDHFSVMMLRSIARQKVRDRL